MNTFFWLSFFFSSPPHHHTCSTQGTPLLEIRERSETSEAFTTKKIYASGGWSLKTDVTSARGCFSQKELRSIRRAVQRAPWKVTSSPIACFAYDPNFTQYVVNGRLRYTHRMCSGKTADVETLAAIDFVTMELADEMPPSIQPSPLPPPPPAKPPVVTPPVVTPPVAACRAEGTPLFEIRKRSEVQEPTSIATIYSTGAWTYSPIDKQGRAGALISGCFDKRTLRDVRSAVNGAPWDVTFSRIVCRAYSPSWTEYFVHGKYEYTARMCGEQRIDDASAAAIKTIEAEIARALPLDDPESTL